LKASDEIEYSHERYLAGRRLRPPTFHEWGYTIGPEKPLRFKETRVHDFRLRADIFCRLRWLDPDQPPVKQDLAVRIWCLDDDVIFREQLDAPEILGRLDTLKGRVMLRYHLDKANDDQPGPAYHLQFGGNPGDDEMCWLHEGVAVPRLAHPPCDLVLACEAVVANLYSPDHVSIVDPTFLNAVLVSQSNLLAEYYRGVSRAMGEGKSVLRSLWVGSIP
jgi:hypothetical protein